MSELPVVVVGAGPTGLAAAAHLRGRGMECVVLEAGPLAGAAVTEWAHIRLFSPWAELIDPQAAAVLHTAGWTTPPLDRYPTGGDWAALYLQPLADALGDSVRYNSTVTGIAKHGRDLLVDSGRDEEPFTVHVTTPQGEERILARAVIDASGTWGDPNPLGGDGLPAIGEASLGDRISYRVPDLSDAVVRDRYAGKHVAIAGTGASAQTALVAFSRLAERYPETRVSWLLRRSSTATTFGGGEDDQLVQRGALGQAAHAAAESRMVSEVSGFRVAAIAATPDGSLKLSSADGQVLDGVDEVVAVTGFRPDLSFLSEIRTDLDFVLEAPRVLAPLIDPNVHSCGTVYPHGAKELAQPDTGFYMVGMKSYGRATSFLALTGFEQVRSVVAALAGDHEAAERVELTLPETGVCGGAGLFDEQGSAASAGCCGVRAPELITVGGISTE